jgi:GNAT superfamily N-acetyltransferase
LTDPIFTVVIDNQDKLSAELEEGLRVFNEAVAGPYHAEPLALSVRDTDGMLIGGLSGLFYWNMLHIRLLWVDERYRRVGCGGALLSRAEEFAIKRGCEIVYLDTYSFQAPGFYRKRGYTALGTLSDAPRGFDTTWFAKRLNRERPQ